MGLIKGTGRTTTMEETGVPGHPLALTAKEIDKESSEKPALKRVPFTNAPVPEKGMPVILVLVSMLQEKVLPLTEEETPTEKAPPLHIERLGGLTVKIGMG